MKQCLIIFSLLLSFTAVATETQTSSISEERMEKSPPASKIKKQVPNQRKIIKQEEEAHEYPSSMGGAENVGAGMATGTGAGSRVGHDVEED